MRIAIDGLPLSQTLSGVGYYTLELARELARTCPGDSLDLVSPRPFIEGNELGISRTNLPNLKLISISPGLRGRRWFLLGLPRYLRQQSIEIFHGTNFEVPLRRVCPSVLTIHDLSLLRFPETHLAERVRRARVRMPLMVRRATAIITPTEAVKNEVCELLNVKRDVVYAVPEATRFTLRMQSTNEVDNVLETLNIRKPFFLAVGTREPRKNLVSLVLAYRELVRSNAQKPQLVIAGNEGWLNDRLESVIDLAEPSERIVVTDRVTDDALYQLYSNCTALVFPSLYEGFGLPPIEAMSCGAPVIANRIPALVETLDGAADFVDCSDVPKLRDAMISVLDDAEKRSEMVTKSLANASRYSWERTAHMTRSVYEIAVRKFANANRQR